MTMKKDEEGTKAEAGSFSEETKLSFMENIKDEILSSAKLNKVKAQNGESQAGSLLKEALQST